MSDSKSAILLSKLGKKSFQGADKVRPGEMPSADESLTDEQLETIGVPKPAPVKTTMSSLGSKEMFQGAKALKPSYTGDAVMGPTEVNGAIATGESEVPRAKKVPYSPIKSYLKTGK